MNYYSVRELFSSSEIKLIMFLNSWGTCLLDYDELSIWCMTSLFFLWTCRLLWSVELIIVAVNALLPLSAFRNVALRQAPISPLLTCLLLNLSPKEKDMCGVHNRLLDGSLDWIFFNFSYASRIEEITRYSSFRRQMCRRRWLVTDDFN